jgi:hypothetical protein
MPPPKSRPVSDSFTELAYYHPHPVWQNGDWLKNLILFFDGVALLLPSRGRNKPFDQDPAIATGLAEHGLLRVLEADTFIDKEAMDAMATQLLEVMDTGVLDALQKNARFHSLSYSRMGGMADPELAQLLIDELVDRGLVKPLADEEIMMHRQVRLLILLLWSQILRSTAWKSQIDPQPVTDHPEIVEGLRIFLREAKPLGVGAVVASDIESVAVDLSTVPIDEILDFREDNGALYRRYALETRSYVLSLTNLPPEERKVELTKRRRDLSELAREIHERSRSTFGKKLRAISLNCIGSWLGGPVGGLVASVSKAPTDPAQGLAHEYLLRAKEFFH